MTARRIGLFGGTFDPIHAGHLHAARAAQRAFQLDRVVFVPARRSPLKGGIEPASGEDRLTMVELATRGVPGWSVSRIELEREGPSFTIDTVRALRGALGEPADAEIYLILGSDGLATLAQWRSVEELVELVQPVVVHREGDPDALLAALARAIPAPLVEKIRRGFLRLPPVEVSSTELRSGGLELAGAERVPEPVLAYIRARGLYGARSR